jgi:hypothetical protein
MKILGWILFIIWAITSFYVGINYGVFYLLLYYIISLIILLIIYRKIS